MAPTAQMSDALELSSFSKKKISGARKHEYKVLLYSALSDLKSFSAEENKIRLYQAQVMIVT